MTDLSRREFSALVAGVAATGFRPATPAAQAQLTANDLIERIKQNIGVEWKPGPIDSVKAGDPVTVVRGVVTTSLATLSVLQQAVKTGANLVITAEPTFYSRADGSAPPAGRGVATPPADPIFTAKNDFIAKNNLVVFRLSEHWRARKPDPLARGLATALGWPKAQAADDPAILNIPAVTLDALASHVKKSLQSRGGMRVIGDPQARVQRIGLLPGSTPIQASLTMLPAVDAIIAGEVREWETAEYARDVAFSGARGAGGTQKGVILVGRVVSEEPGMDMCATWLRTFVTEVPVRHISAGDPYWRPTL